MDHTTLDLGLGEDRQDGFLESAQPIHAGNENILHAATLQIADDTQPEIGGFVAIPNPMPQDIPVTFQIHTQDCIDGGTRTIMLGKQALEILKNHKKAQEMFINAVGERWTNLDLVFPSGIGTPLTASNIRRAFRKLLATSGLPKIRFHDLRHTAASLMLNHGIPVLIVSKRLGHSKPSITLDVYGHLLSFDILMSFKKCRF
jgi:hypothetical protein